MPSSSSFQIEKIAVPVVALLMASVVAVVVGVLTSGVPFDIRAVALAFAFFLGAQFAVLAFLVFYKPRPAVFAGAGLSLSLYFVLFAVFIRDSREGMTWLGYFSSLPGAVIAMLVIGYRRSSWTSVAVGSAAWFSFVVVLLGLSLNQAFVCYSLMFCGR